MFNFSLNNRKTRFLLGKMKKRSVTHPEKILSFSCTYARERFLQVIAGRKPLEVLESYQCLHIVLMFLYCWFCWFDGRGVLLGERMGEEGTCWGIAPGTKPEPPVGELEMLETRPWSLTIG